MSIGEKVWDALSAVVKMNDKVERLAQASSGMGLKLETLTERVVRLETALEIGLAVESRRLPRSKPKGR